MRRAAVTGASGFIGRRIVERLIADGWQVRALTRSPACAHTLEERGVQTVPGCLSDASALATLVHGASALVHCAGVVRGHCYAAFERVNVAGTQRLGQAAAAAGVPVLALSSLAAREPQLSDYARSKRAMENTLDDVHGLRWTALRPPAVYGPGDRELRPLFVAMARGIALLPAPPQARVSLLYVDDLASVVSTWLADGDRPAGVYELHDGTEGGYRWQDVVDVAQRLLERRIRCIRAPAWGLGLVAQLNARVAPRLGYAPMLTPGKLREVRHSSWVCDNTALTAALDWRPRVTLREGLRRTYGWGRPGQPSERS